MGRKQKPYQTTWGEIIPGLYRECDGRWKIIETGKKFTCHDEHQAVDRFKQMHPPASVFVPIAMGEPCDIIEAKDRVKGMLTQPVVIEGERDDDTDDVVGYEIDQRAVWDFLREQLLADPIHAAKMTGIPQLANFKSMDIPVPSLKLDHILTLYSQHSEATAKTKREVAATFKDWLIKHSGAQTLDDLTDEKLRAFRAHVVSKIAPATAALYFSRIRTVLRTAAKKGGANKKQIGEAIERLTSLYAPAGANSNDDPHPIAVEDFHKLLEAAKETNTPDVWRAMLLMGLNGALYMEDLCDLKWATIDLDKKTFVSRRKKKGFCIRAATLWDETVEALKALPRRGNSPYVFTSQHGTRYNKNTKINDFADVLRVKAKLSEEVKWSWLRDGAYTAAVHAPGIDEKFARLLAGHKAHGLQDKYVLRNPKCVKGACDAVYREYFQAA